MDLKNDRIGPVLVVLLGFIILPWFLRRIYFLSIFYKVTAPIGCGTKIAIFTSRRLICITQPTRLGILYVLYDANSVPYNFHVPVLFY
jgi:hypothetical protein